MWILACIFDVVYYYDFFRSKCKGVFYRSWNFCSCNCGGGFDTGKAEEIGGKSISAGGGPCVGVLFVVENGDSFVERYSKIRQKVT